MKREGLVGMIGLFLLVAPQLGVPEEVRDRLLQISGVVLLLVAYLLVRRQILNRDHVAAGERTSDTFVETTGSLFDSK